MMDGMTIRILASMRTSWARDVEALRSIGHSLKNLPQSEHSRQGDDLLNANTGLKGVTQMVTEVIHALTEPDVARGI